MYKQSSWCFLYLFISQFLRHFLFIFKDHRSCHGPTKLTVSHWVSSEATNEETLGNCTVKYWERINADCRAAAGKTDFALASMQQPGWKSNLEAKIKTWFCSYPCFLASKNTRQSFVHKPGRTWLFPCNFSVESLQCAFMRNKNVDLRFSSKQKLSSFLSGLPKKNSILVFFIASTNSTLNFIWGFQFYPHAVSPSKYINKFH